jgi:hypothetical protein
MNSGVMVVEPSETLFKDMMNKVDSLPSYTGGKYISLVIVHVLLCIFVSLFLFG